MNAAAVSLPLHHVGDNLHEETQCTNTLRLLILLYGVSLTALIRRTAMGSAAARKRPACLFATAQCGTPHWGRSVWGHSMYRRLARVGHALQSLPLQRFLDARRCALPMVVSGQRALALQRRAVLRIGADLYGDTQRTFAEHLLKFVCGTSPYSAAQTHGDGHCRWS